MTKAEYLAAYYQANKERIKARSAKYREQNKEKVLEYARKYHAENREHLCERMRQKIAADPEKNRRRVREWLEKNRDRARPGRQARAKLYETRKARRTPPWLTKQQIKEIAGFYAEAIRLSEVTGIKHHVDHIVPLRGRAVSGLHVPWNLQVITAAENQRKHNTFCER
jgi:hypothetical protein